MEDGKSIEYSSTSNTDMNLLYHQMIRPSSMPAYVEHLQNLLTNHIIISKALCKQKDSKTIKLNLLALQERT